MSLTRDLVRLIEGKTKCESDLRGASLFVLAHPAIDAAIELNGRLAGKVVRKVNVEAYRAALDVCDRPLPEDAYSAKFSVNARMVLQGSGLPGARVEALTGGILGLVDDRPVRSLELFPAGRDQLPSRRRA